MVCVGERHPVLPDAAGHPGKVPETRDFITTNGLFPSLDNHRMARECLDVYTYDSYPNFAYDVDADPKHDKTLKTGNGAAT